MLQGQPLHSIKYALQIFTDASKEEWGAHLNNLVPSRKQAAYKLPRTESSLFGPETVQDLCSDKIVLVATDNSVENLDLVHQETSYTQSPTHSAPSECGSKQAIQTRPDHSNRVVSPSRGLPNNMQQAAPASDRPICHEVQQVTSVCVTSTRPPGLGSGCTQPAMGGPGCVSLPTSSHFGQSSGEVAGPPLPQNHSDHARVAQHALVLGFSGHVKPDPPEPAQPGQSNTALQSDSSQESAKPISACLSSIVSAIKERGFSEEMAARIKAPQRESTRSVYEAEWTIFVSPAFVLCGI